MALRAVIFDVDGVVVTPPFRFAAYLEREHRLTRQHTHAFFTGVFQDCLTGQADLRHVLPPFLAAWSWPDTLDAFLARWFAEEHLVDDRLLTVIRDLRRRGLVCALATNQERYRLAYLRQQMGLAEQVDAIFGSAEIGCFKDNARFYQHVEAALGLAGGEMLFWDDTAANVAQARACGWQAEVYRNFDEFRPILDRYLAADPA